MSIIHDALKKVQQGQASHDDKTPTAPVTKSPSTSGNIFAAPKDPEVPDDQLPVEQLQPVQNKARSILALLCAFAFTIGSLVFCYKQLRACCPQIDDYAISMYDKLLHRKKDAKVLETLKPLAKITVNPPKQTPPPKAAAPIVPVLPKLITTPIPPDPPAPAVEAKPYVPQTLNIHGVMSNGSRNVVLIDDQVYQEGDNVDGVKIAKISLDSITVDNNGVEQTIRVKN